MADHMFCFGGKGLAPKRVCVEMVEDRKKSEMESKGSHDVDAALARQAQEGNLLDLLKEMAAEVMHGDHDDRSVVQRTRDAVRDKAPRFKLAARSASSDVMRWMHRGGPWRAFLVSIVGIVMFVALASLATFMLFFLTATANTVAIAFLMSLSGIGAFVGMFFMLLTAIYVGALIVAALAISSIAFFSITAVLLVTGWIGFSWLVWKGAKKSFDLFRGSLAVTASALSAVSAAGSTQIIAIEKRTY